MKETRKELIQSTLISIGMAMTIFCLAGIVFDVRDGGTFTLEQYRFTKMVAGCVLIGLGFGVPSVVYRNDRIPLPIRVVIHMGIGCVVYTVVAYAVGWIGGATTLAQGIVIAVIQLAVAFGVWGLFLRHYQKEAERMNERLQQMQSGE